MGNPIVQPTQPTQPTLVPTRSGDEFSSAPPLLYQSLGGEATKRGEGWGVSLSAKPSADHLRLVSVEGPTGFCHGASYRPSPSCLKRIPLPLFLKSNPLPFFLKGRGSCLRSASDENNKPAFQDAEQFDRDVLWPNSRGARPVSLEGLAPARGVPAHKSTPANR